MLHAGKWLPTDYCGREYLFGAFICESACLCMKFVCVMILFVYIIGVMILYLCGDRVFILPALECDVLKRVAGVQGREGRGKKRQVECTHGVCV